MGYFANMGGFTLELDDQKWRLMGEQFCHLVETHRIPVPALSFADIMDKSKADWIVKSRSCLQIGWLVIQLIGRASRGLQTTPLELFTLAIVICALVSYCFWWYKPKDVLTPHVKRLHGATHH